MNALLTFDVGGRSYPLTRSPHCRVCNSSPAIREDAERAVISGASFAEAARSLPPDTGLTPKNIARHCRRHLPIEQEVLQRLIQAVGGERADLVEQGVTRALKGLSLAGAVVDAATEQVRSGKQIPTLSEGLRALRLVHVWEEMVRADADLASRVRDRDEVIERVLGLAKLHMAPASWSQFLIDIDSNSALSPFLPSPGGTPMPCERPCVASAERVALDDGVGNTTTGTITAIGNTGTITGAGNS